MQLCLISISNQHVKTPSINCTIRRHVSQLSLLLTLQFSMTSRHSATNLFECSHGIFPPPPPKKNIKDCNSIGLLGFQH
jgi:hypothetical protein